MNRDQIEEYVLMPDSRIMMKIHCDISKMVSRGIYDGVIIEVKDKVWKRVDVRVADVIRKNLHRKFYGI